MTLPMATSSHRASSTSDGNRRVMDIRSDTKHAPLLLRTSSISPAAPLMWRSSGGNGPSSQSRDSRNARVMGVALVRGDRPPLPCWAPSAGPNNPRQIRRPHRARPAARAGSPQPGRPGPPTPRLRRRPRTPVVAQQRPRVRLRRWPWKTGSMCCHRNKNRIKLVWGAGSISRRSLPNVPR